MDSKKSCSRFTYGYHTFQLQDYCVESILEDSKSFITSKGFPLLDKDTLCELLKRDDFLIEEVIC